MNLASVVVLAAIGTGAYFGSSDAAMGDYLSLPDPVFEDGATLGEGEFVHTVSGPGHGYLLQSGDTLINGLRVGSIEISPPMPDCGEAAWVRVHLEDPAEQLGESDYGPYFQTYDFTVSAFAITPAGIHIRAHNEERGAFELVGSYAEGQLVAWQSDPDALDTLLIADVTVGEVTVPDVALGFWIGD